MKRGTPRHPKTKALARALKIPTPHAAGLLASLWDWASDFCPDGGIGLHTDEEIAEACGWPERRAAQLISAMTSERSLWLDTREDCRLYIHDWAEHCEDTVHRKLARAGIYFANGETPKLTRLNDKERARVEQLYAQSAHDVRTPCALPLPLPLPLPGPIPKPEPKASEQQFVPVREQSVPTESSPACPPASSSGFTPAAAILKPPDPPPTNGDVRYTREAIARYFPDPDDGIVGCVFQKAQAAAPGLTDEECGIWVHAVVPPAGFEKARGPGWFTTTVPDELAKRPQDARLLHAFVAGEIPREEAAGIVRDGKCDWRLAKALKVWMAA